MEKASGNHGKGLLMDYFFSLTRYDGEKPTIPTFTELGL